MSSCDSLNIAYCNVRGLNETCFNTLISSINTNQYDIIVASETWFLNRTHYTNHPFYLTESLYPTNPHINRRQDGGLVILASPSISNNITITSSSQYSISLRINDSNKILTFVYFPPSLSDSILQNELTLIGHTNYLIGDVNIRLGALSGDHTTSTNVRKQILLSYLTLYNLSYQRNSNKDVISRTDHLFTNMNNSNWTYDDPPFRTDHKLMQISLQGYNLPKFKPLGTQRYDIKPLYNHFFKNEFIHIYENLYADFLLIEAEAAIASCCYSMILPTTLETQDIIDTTYDNFISTIHTLLDTTLTTYNTEDVKQNKDTLLDTNSLPTSTIRTMRIFKRSQRSFNDRNPIISSTPNLSPLEECSAHYTSQFNSSESPPTIERQNDINLSLKFDEKTIIKKIQRYSAAKSGGPDNIHTIVWKTLTLSPIFNRTLSALFQLFAASSLIPSAWSTCNLHLLKKDPTNPIAINTRPIALSNILRRIFESILLKQILSKDEPWSQLNFGQAGFRRGFSTQSHLILSDELSRRKNKYSIFLDLKSAFDSISWQKLNELLTQINCPPSFHNIILSLICKPADLLLTVNHSEQKLIKTRKGVFQGGGISAFIFSLYINPLAIALNSTATPHSPLGLLFADDIQIKTNEAAIAQTALDICTIYGLEYYMTWNIKKCAIVSIEPTPLILAGQYLPFANQYKYLGIIHKHNGLDLSESYKIQASKQSSLLISLSDKNWHPKMKLTIFRSFIRPLTEYAGTLTYIWALKHPSRTSTLNLMKLQHQMALKWIFSCKKYTATLDFLSGLGSWKHRMDCLHAGLARSLQQMAPENPLTKARSIFLLSTSPNFILQDCFKSSYWSAYQRVKYRDLMKPLRFNTWKNQMLQTLATDASKHSALISYLGKFKPSNIKSFFNLPSDLFFDISAWRLNHCFLHLTCTCGSTFNRSHVSCLLESDESYKETINSPKYIRELASITSARAPYFSVLDHHLNDLNYEMFKLLFNTIKSNLI